MAARAEQTRVLNMPIDFVVNKMRQIGNSDLRVNLTSENPMPPNGVWFRVLHGTSFSSWGEKITVTLTALSPQSTQIHILSECGMPTQLVDWGKNNKNVNAVFDYIVR